MLYPTRRAAEMAFMTMFRCYQCGNPTDGLMKCALADCPNLERVAPSEKATSALDHLEEISIEHHRPAAAEGEPTPRTDAVASPVFYGMDHNECKRDSTRVASVFIDDWQALLDVARTLERELDGAKEKLRLMQAQYVREIDPLLEEDGETPKHIAFQKRAEQVERERDEAKRDEQAIRVLMNSYNLGGWTDALQPMKRALEAEHQLSIAWDELAALRHDLERHVAIAGEYRRDVERYRWLRERHADGGEDQWFVYGGKSDDLDADIDAARSDSKEAS